MSTLLSYAAIAAAARQNKPQLPSKAALKRTALGVALVAALGFAGERGYDYWKVGRFQVSTDNAYVQADYTTVAPKISGYITEVLVERQRDGQGRPDPGAHRRSRLPASRSTRRAPTSTTADAAIRNLDAQIAQQQSVIDQDKADDRLRPRRRSATPPPTTPATTT